MPVTDIADRIAEARRRLKLSQKEMSDRLGMPLRTYQDNERGTSPPGSKLLTGLAENGFDGNWLLLGTGEPTRKVGERVLGIHVPVLRADETRDSYAYTDDEARQHAILAMLPETAARLTGSEVSDVNGSHCLAAIEMSDSSMEPLIPEGSLVLFEPSDSSIEPDGICVIAQGDGLAVRHCQLMPNGTLATLALRDRKIEVLTNWRRRKLMVGRCVAVLARLPNSVSKQDSSPS